MHLPSPGLGLGFWIELVRVTVRSKGGVLDWSCVCGGAIQSELTSPWLPWFWSLFSWFHGSLAWRLDCPPSIASSVPEDPPSRQPAWVQWAGTGGSPRSGLSSRCLEKQGGTQWWPIRGCQLNVEEDNWKTMRTLNTALSGHLLDRRSCVICLVMLLHCAVFYCAVLYCTALYCTALHCTTLYCLSLHCTALHCIVPYCTALFCPVQHCTALHCTVAAALTNWSHLVNPPLILTAATFGVHVVAAVRAFSGVELLQHNAEAVHVSFLCSSRWTRRQAEDFRRHPQEICQAGTVRRDATEIRIWRHFRWPALRASGVANESRVNAAYDNTTEIRFSVMRSPQFWVSGYCTKWRIQGQFW